MKAKGFNGVLRVVTEWATQKRKDAGTATRDGHPTKPNLHTLPPPARQSAVNISEFLIRRQIVVLTVSEIPTTSI